MTSQEFDNTAMIVIYAISFIIYCTIATILTIVESKKEKPKYKHITYVFLFAILPINVLLTFVIFAGLLAYLSYKTITSAFNLTSKIK